MATSKQASRHTHNFHKCSHASVALTQARPNNTGNHLEQQICSFLSPDYGLLLELHALTLVARSYARLNRYMLQSDSQLGEQHLKNNMLQSDSQLGEQHLKNNMLQSDSQLGEQHRKISPPFS